MLSNYYLKRMRQVSTEIISLLELVLLDILYSTWFFHWVWSTSKQRTQMNYENFLFYYHTVKMFKTFQIVSNRSNRSWKTRQICIYFCWNLHDILVTENTQWQTKDWLRQKNIQQTVYASIPPVTTRFGKTRRQTEKTKKGILCIIEWMVSLLCVTKISK